MKLRIVGDSHVVALAAGRRLLPPSAWPQGIPIAKLFSFPATRRPFHQAGADGVAFLDEDMGRRLHTVTGDSVMRAGEDVFAISLPFSTSLLLWSATWRTHRPWRRCPDGLQPVSDGAVAAMVLDHFRHALAWLADLRGAGVRFFVMESPPVRQRDIGVKKTGSPEAVIELDRLARDAIDAELGRLGIPVLRAPREAYQGAPRASFLREELGEPTDRHHANAAYAALQLPRLLDFAASLGPGPQGSVHHAAMLAEAEARCAAGESEAGFALFDRALAEVDPAADRAGFAGVAERYLAAAARGREHVEHARALLARLRGLAGSTLPLGCELVAARSKVLMDGPERLRVFLRALHEGGTPALRTEAIRGGLIAAIALRDRAALGFLAAQGETLRDEIAAGRHAVETAQLLGDAALLLDAPHRARPFYRAVLAARPDLVPALIGEAAVALEAGEVAAARSGLERALAETDPVREPLLATLLSYGTAALAAPPEPSVEAFVFTHLHRREKLQAFADLAGPGLGLIERTVSTMRERMELPPGFPITVLYDHQDTSDNATYRRNLEAWCAEESLGLVVNHGNGLRRQWLDAMARARTDLVLLVEHDLEFQPTCPPLSRVAGTMRARPDVFYIRYARRSNVVAGYDTILTQGARDRESRICRTPSFSNNPQLVRRDYLLQVIRPLISERSGADQENFGAGGVERTVNARYRHVEARVGLPAAMRLFGTFIWGHPGDPRTATHIGR
ncbi:hypothetical protein [Falsiroseomonas sp. HW251]|uniref:hypothetical protein n=1 Tax=Falsiroseomonas sp. HW251 TaxID=3390998 RepID=UPI003D31DAFD